MRTMLLHYLTMENIETPTRQEPVKRRVLWNQISLRQEPMTTPGGVPM